MNILNHTATHPSLERMIRSAEFRSGDRVIVQGEDGAWYHGAVLRDYNCALPDEMQDDWSDQSASFRQGIQDRQRNLMPRLALVALDQGGIYVAEIAKMRMEDPSLEADRIDAGIDAESARCRA